MIVTSAEKERERESRKGEVEFEIETYNTAARVFLCLKRQRMMAVGEEEWR